MKNALVIKDVYDLGTIPNAKEIRPGLGPHDVTVTISVIIVSNASDSRPVLSGIFVGILNRGNEVFVDSGEIVSLLGILDFIDKMPGRQVIGQPQRTSISHTTDNGLKISWEKRDKVRPPFKPLEFLLEIPGGNIPAVIDLADGSGEALRQLLSRAAEKILTLVDDFKSTGEQIDAKG